MNNHTPYPHIAFHKSAQRLEELPEDSGSEVALVGRSNVGKSSAINTITGRKGLARSSKTPGSTQTINVFQLDDTLEARLIDLPGYGYAKAPLQIRKRIGHMVDNYLQNRHSLRGLLLLMDIRHPLQESDMRLIQWAWNCHITMHILLTKSDKLGYGAATAALRYVEQQFDKRGLLVTVQLFSSIDQKGLEEARCVLDKWIRSHSP